MSLDTLSGSGSQFPRRRVPRSIPGGLGNEIPRRRLQFSFLRRKRYSIPAQKGTPEQSGRIWRPIPAQNFIRGQSARVMRSIPRRTSSAGNLRVLGGQFPRRWLHFPFQAYLAAHSRAGNKKKLTQKVSFSVYFLKYVLLLNLLVIADQNLHQKSFSHQNPLYIPFLLLGICP